MKSLGFVIPLLLLAALAGCGGGGSSPPPVPNAISISGLPAGDKLAAVTTYALSVSETSNGQAVSPGSVTFTLDTSAVGTLTGSTLKTGTVNATGQLTARDTANGLTTTVTVAVGSTHPVTAGDTVAFAGTLEETIVRPANGTLPAQPPYTSTYAVSLSSTTATGRAFAGKTGLAQFTTVETDTGALPPLPVTTTGTFENFVPASNGSVDVRAYGNQASDTNGSTYTTTLGEGNGLLDILPETSGSNWINNASERYAETEPDSTTIARSVQANGAYTETDTFADPTLPAATIAVNSDRSGNYENANIGDEFYPASISVASPHTSGGKSVIVVTVVSGGTTQTLDFGDWYPVATLYSDSVRLSTNQPLPVSCRLSSSFGTTANVTVELTTRLDPVLGTYETRRDATYVAPFYGTVCTLLTDTLEDYYDYSGQSASPLGSVVQQTTTLSEALGFRSGTIAGAAALRSGRTTASAKAGNDIELAGTLAAARTDFTHAVQRLYSERRRALRRFAHTHTSLQWMGR